MADGRFLSGPGSALRSVLLLFVQSFLHLGVIVQGFSHRVDDVLLWDRGRQLHVWAGFLLIISCMAAYLQVGEQVGQLHEQRQKDESDEADLRRRFGHFVSVHKGGDWETLQLLCVTLGTKKPSLMVPFTSLPNRLEACRFLH